MFSLVATKTIGKPSKH